MQIYYDRPGFHQWLQSASNEGCSIVLATTAQVNPVTREKRSYVSQYYVFFQIAGAQVCLAQGAVTHEWNPQSNLEVAPLSLADRDGRRHLVLE